MAAPGSISGRQIAAARALVSVSQAALAEAAGVSLNSLKRMEANSVNVPAANEPCKLTAVRRALEQFGAVFVPEEGTLGAGVRLKFNRAETRQIAGWEGEGGRVADDDIQ
jgi:hypothetical protein